MRESLPEELIRELVGVLGRTRFLVDRETLFVYECDGLTNFRVIPSAVALPDSTEQVQAVVRVCHRERIPFVARGSGTGLGEPASTEPQQHPDLGERFDVGHQLARLRLPHALFDLRDEAESFDGIRDRGVFRQGSKRVDSALLVRHRFHKSDSTIVNVRPPGLAEDHSRR